MVTKKSTQAISKPRRAPVVVKKTKTTRHKAAPSPRSFRPSTSTRPFFTFQFTEQTVYWLILSVIVLLLGLWVIDINNKVQMIYDEIDQASMSVEDISTAQ